MKLTDAEREALHESVDIAENCTCCGSDYGWTHVYADVERLISARLEQQRETIRVALVQQADVALVARNQYAVAGLGFAASAFGERAETWEAAAALVREYQPGEGT